MPLSTFHAVQKMLFQIFLVLQFIPMIWTAHQPPTLVLVPGAWHSPIHYSLLLAEIEKAGYPTSSARSPSCGSTDPYSQSVVGDAAFIRQNLLLPLINAGKDIVLVMHSYGGCPGAMAAKGLSKAEMPAASRKGGIIGLIFICAFVAQEGQTLIGSLPGKKLDPWVVDYVSIFFPFLQSCKVLNQQLIRALFRETVS